MRAVSILTILPAMSIGVSCTAMVILCSGNLRCRGRVTIGLVLQQAHSVPRFSFLLALQGRIVIVCFLDEVSQKPGVGLGSIVCGPANESS